MPKKCDCCKNEDAKFHVCDSCLNQKKYVVNSLLAYIATYVHRASQIQLKLAVLGFYSEDDVNEAKDVLFKATEHLDVNVKNIQRQNSATRSAKEAEVEDILAVFQRLDGLGFPDIVTFCVSDVSSLPPGAPEQGGSVMSLVESMSKMFKEVQQLQQTVAGIQNDVLKHDEVLRASPRPTTAPMRSTRGPKLVEESEMAEAVRQVSDNATKSYATTVKSLEVDAFTKVTGSNGHKRPLKGGGRERLKQKGIAGTANKSDSLKAGPEMVHVQLTNVHPDIDDETIKDYIKQKDASIQVTDIKDTSSVGWDTKRFIVTCSSSAQETVLSPDFWPDKIYYKRWYMPRQKPMMDRSKTNPSNSS